MTMRAMAWAADYVLGTAIVVAHLIVIALSDRRAAIHAARASA